ncbi:hypothetical protein [uncultured Dubosiella sp.]|uniref:hypothetical protein n=1 Tax=uncultured Dubosiella sp. TaxID=1937011 RepID=UPI0026075585|nr:hypothetical protein [uncultured Dubosiella sp.]
MSDEMKVLFRQLQLAGLGIVIGIVGLFADRREIFFIGIGVLVFGIIRFLILKKYISDLKNNND